MLPAGGFAEHSAGYSISERPDSTRNHLQNTAWTGGSAAASDCNSGRSESPHGKSDCVGEDELRQAASRRRSRKNGGDGGLDTSPPFSRAHRHESAAVSKATSLAGGARADAGGSP